jgi:hypothetical protein
LPDQRPCHGARQRERKDPCEHVRSHVVPSVDGRFARRVRAARFACCDRAACDRMRAALLACLARAW